MNFFNKLKLYISAHKFWSTALLIAIIGIAFWGYSNATSTTGVTRYVLSPVTKGTIVSSVADSGQVSALNQINITPTVSGALTEVNVKPGDAVRAGETLFNIDDTTAQKSVRDAQITLQNANLALQKLQLQNSDASLNTALTQAYNSGFSGTTTAISDLNSTLNGLESVLLTKQDLSDSVVRAKGATAQNYEQTALTAYYAAKTAFQKNNADFAMLSNTPGKADVKNIIQETYDTTNLLSIALKDSADFVSYMQQDSTNASSFASYQTTLAGYSTTINGDLTSLLSAQTNIQNSETAFPTDNLNTQSAQITVQQAQNTLSDAEQNLSYYHITAPFDGVMASVPVIKGQNVGSGTTLGTIITSKDLAVVSLNEIDVAKISLGEKATLTFNAIPNLTIAGQVVEIDSTGTVSQGVVNYNVQISFDTTSNEGVKPGMSVNAAIITAVAQNVLEVPSSAIKTQGGVSYVQMFNTALPAPAAGVQGSVSPTPPRNQPVVTGVTDGTSTEITSGLKEGDEIVTKTITSTTKTTATTTAPSILGGGGGGRGGGGVRIP